MRPWLTVVTISIALVALWALPPSLPELPTYRTTPERSRLEAVEREAARTHAALRMLRWSDSLSALVAGAPAGGLVLGPPTTETLEPERVRAWMEAQHDVLARLPRRDPEMRVGVFWVPVRSGALPGLPLRGSTDGVTFVGERDGAPYCMRAVPYTDRLAEILLRPLPAVGACLLYAKHGMASDGIHAWMEASSLGFARIATPEHAARYARTALQPTEPLLRLFGRDRARLSGENLTVQACLAGRAAACERAVTRPELVAATWGDEAWLVAHTPASSVATTVSHPPFGYLDDALLYEWEDRFGSEAFHRFWTSSAPVPEAFEAAFGEPLGEWVRDWAGQHVGLYRAGPALPWGSVWTSILALAALAATAAVAGVRRRVGGG